MDDPAADAPDMTDSAIDRLRDKVALTRVVVPPHTRVKNGRVEKVDGFTYDRKGGAPKMTAPKVASAPAKPKPTYVDVKEIGAILRKAGIPAAKKSGTRVRGAPRVTPGYEAKTWLPLEPNRPGGKTHKIVTVQWMSSTGPVKPPNERDSEEAKGAIAQILSDLGYVVTRGIMGVHIDVEH